MPQNAPLSRDFLVFVTLSDHVSTASVAAPASAGGGPCTTPTSVIGTKMASGSFEGDSITQALNALDDPEHNIVLILLVEVVAPQLAIRGAYGSGCWYGLGA